MATKFSLKLDYIVYANPDQVFEALTNPGIISTWGGGFSIVEEKVGGVFEIFDGWVKGEVTVYEPGKELGYTWRPEEWSKNTIPSQANIKLKKHDAGTAVIITHTDFPSQEEADKHNNGWVDYVFDPMNDFFVMQKEENSNK